MVVAVMVAGLCLFQGIVCGVLDVLRRGTSSDCIKRDFRNSRTSQQTALVRESRARPGTARYGSVEGQEGQAGQETSRMRRQSDDTTMESRCDGDDDDEW